VGLFFRWELWEPWELQCFQWVSGSQSFLGLGTAGNS
jgi:hypothetical protein